MSAYRIIHLATTSQFKPLYQEKDCDLSCVKNVAATKEGYNFYRTDYHSFILHVKYYIESYQQNYSAYLKIYESVPLEKAEDICKEIGTKGFFIQATYYPPSIINNIDIMVQEIEKP